MTVNLKILFVKVSSINKNKCTRRELRCSDIVKVDLLQTGSKCKISLRSDWDYTQKVAMNLAIRTTLGEKLQRFVHFSTDIHLIIILESLCLHYLE